MSRTLRGHVETDATLQVGWGPPWGFWGVAGPLRHGQWLNLSFLRTGSEWWAIMTDRIIRTALTEPAVRCRETKVRRCFLCGAPDCTPTWTLRCFYLASECLLCHPPVGVWLHHVVYFPSNLLKTPPRPGGRDRGGESPWDTGMSPVIKGDKTLRSCTTAQVQKADIGVWVHRIIQNPA